ncbi:hypothetical protein [Streptomyces sp. YGL11-2]|uniref:hypothetical protein n=1 Tax=Streptomyces sp. YGL11-2 TaxID=3414028 RepID=UPI003CE9D81A
MSVPVPASGLNGRSFMVVGHDMGGKTDPSGAASWGRLDGWKHWLTVTGSHHGTFTDLPILAEEPAVPEPPGTTVSAQRSVQTARACVRAFFDLHLRGMPEPHLDGPSAASSDVTFHS